MAKRVYSFNEGNKEMKALLGGKGANLSEMVSLGLPVPDGFTITTETCMEYLGDPKNVFEVLKDDVLGALSELEDRTGKAFNSDNLLLVSVRSGAAISMPGMMDTILNLGLNDDSVEKLAENTGNRSFAYDSYRRLLQMFGDVVYQIPPHTFARALDKARDSKGYKFDSDLKAEDLQALIAEYKQIYKEYDREFPQDPVDQLFEAVRAVFDSWNNPRAIFYRQLNDIANDLGTAVNVQEMVFGNSGDTSGTGVAFTRDAATGEKCVYGEYLLNAQGEDVVAGIRTPQPIAELEKQMPEVYAQFTEITQTLEAHYQDMQDIEFTIENGKLYILQTRNGKRTAQAAFKIAVDLVNEGVIDKEQALLMLDPKSIDQLLHPSFKEEVLEDAVLISDKGLPASPGAATGRVYFDAETAAEKASDGEAVILVRMETSPEDIEGMAVSQAIVTSTGGMTSHAAVVARGMGRCCVAGCVDLDINYDTKTINYPGGSISEGDVISVDGTLGQIFLGELETVPTATDETFEKVMEWADEVSQMKVRMNAESLTDIQAGIDFGAAGIGLARTEHMFFAPERLVEIRRFILANNPGTRVQAINNILPHQTDDFVGIFKLTKDLPVVIRLLDPPLHEFLPHDDSEIEVVSKQLKVGTDELRARVKDLQETNPMLGHRGCRLAITYPELYLMQAEAIIRAALQVKELGINVAPEIMIPLVSTSKELETLRKQIIDHINRLFDELGETVDYTIGTMIETPRACVTSEEIAAHSDFFSFGTNDLTQMVFGFSRDDANNFIHDYSNQGILEQDPFQTIDLEGVGTLVKLGVENGRRVKPDLKLGVCGELGGDPKSVEFFNQVGLDYVSCSPFRVPGAKLAAAQSTIKLR